MKKTNLILAILAVVILATGSLLALPRLDNDPDEDPKKKKSKVKIIKVENGVKTVIDTIMVIDGDIELIGVEDVEVNIDSILNEVEMTLNNISIDCDLGEGSEKKMLISIGGDSINDFCNINIDNIDEIIETSLENLDIEKKICKKIVITEEDGVENVKVLKCDGIEDIDIDIDVDEILKTVKVDIDGAESGKKICKTIVISGEEGEENIKIISKDGEESVDIDLDEILKTVTMTIDGEDSEKKICTVVIESGCMELNEEDYKSLKSTGIKNTKKNKLNLKELSISPNPSDGNINLEFSSDIKDPIKINIFNLAGKKVYSEKMKNFEGKYSKKINLSSEDSGTYFVNIAQGKMQTTKKIILK